MDDYFKRLLFIMDNGKININNKKKGNKNMEELENSIEYLICKNPLIKTIDDAKLVIDKGLEDYTDYEYIKETENELIVIIESVDLYIPLRIVINNEEVKTYFPDIYESKEEALEAISKDNEALESI